MAPPAIPRQRSTKCRRRVPRDGWLWPRNWWLAYYRDGDDRPADSSRAWPVREIASRLRIRGKLSREETTQAICRVTGELVDFAWKTTAEAAAVLRNGRRGAEGAQRRCGSGARSE
jgi:hypothetical protein